MQFSRLTEPVCLSGPIYTLHVLCALSKNLTIFPRNELRQPHMQPHSFEKPCCSSVRVLPYSKEPLDVRTQSGHLHSLVSHLDCLKIIQRFPPLVLNN